MRSSLPNRRRFLLLLLLGSVALLQVAAVIKGYGWLWAGRIWRTPTSNAKERAAIFLLGGPGAEFLDFIRAEVPPEGPVVTPAYSGYFSFQNILQFFLKPRPIIDCGCGSPTTPDVYTESCLHCLARQEYNIPAIGDFPPPETVQETKTFIAHKNGEEPFFGLFASNAPQFSSAPSAPPDTLTPLGALAMDLSALAGLMILGALLAGALLGRLDWIEGLILGLPLGAGVLTWCLFLLSWAAVPISLRTAGLVYAALLLATSLFHIARGTRFHPPPKLRQITPAWKGLSLETFVPAIPWIGIGALLLLAGVLSVGRAYSTYDSIANWALKGYAIADAGTILAGKDWGGHGLAYPLNLPLMISLFRLINGDFLPGSKLLFPIFAGSLLLGSYRFLRRQGVGPVVASSGLLLLLSVPHIFLHATLGFANIPFTTYLVLGMLWSAEAIFKNHPPSLILGGTLLALAGWTRPEGLGFSAIIMLGLLSTQRISRRGKVHLLPWTLPLVVFTGGWLLFGVGYMAGDSTWDVTRVFTEQLAKGGISLDALFLTLRFAIKRAATPGIWGFLFPLASVLLMIGVRNLRPRTQPLSFSLLLCALLATTLPIGLFFVASFSRPEFEKILEFNFDRALFPAAAFTLLAALLASGRDGPFAISDLHLSRSTHGPIPEKETEHPKKKLGKILAHKAR